MNFYLSSFGIGCGTDLAGQRFAWRYTVYQNRSTILRTMNFLLCGATIGSNDNRAHVDKMREWVLWKIDYHAKRCTENALLPWPGHTSDSETQKGQTFIIDPFLIFLVLFTQVLRKLHPTPPFSLLTFRYVHRHSARICEMFEPKVARLSARKHCYEIVFLSFL